MTTRTILHVDMDAFFAAVELRRRPELRGRPVVVGSPGSRGVVAAASYEARRSGVHSAMSSAVAQRRCPDAVFLPPDHAHYAEVSSAVFDIFRSFTPLVEGISLDEAFLDVTGARRLLGTGVEIGHDVRSRVAGELALTCSVGVATNKLLAKLASEAAKPRADALGITPGAGVVEVLPGQELAFLHPLPVQALWGVGPATLERLQRLGVRTVGDLAQLDERVLVGVLGHAHGRHLAALSRGIDDRPVEPDRAVKSIGHEETFSADLHTPEEVQAELVRMADAVAARLRRHGVGARTLTLKVRFSGFSTITRSTTVASPLTTGPGILRAVEPLAASVDPTPGVRLLGISGSQLVEPAEQLSFDDLVGAADDAPGVDAAWAGASEALDAIRRRFGGGSIGPASSVRGERD